VKHQQISDGQDAETSKNCALYGSPASAIWYMEKIHVGDAALPQMPNNGGVDFPLALISRTRHTPVNASYAFSSFSHSASDSLRKPTGNNGFGNLRTEDLLTR
jgi:hypothetical protein